MTRIYILALTVALSAPCFSQHTWNELFPGVSAVPIEKVFFLDESKGWAVGNSGNIMHTQDGGLTWSQQFYGGTELLNSVTFTTPLTGYIVGANETYLRTIDGGSTWTIPAPPSGSLNHLYDIQFADEQNGWIYGYSESLRTTDGGNTWTPMTGLPVTVSDMDFVNASDGWVVGSSAIYFGYTHDGGITWTAITTPTPVYKLYAHTFEKVTIVGGDGSIHQTNDAGVTWIERLPASSINIIDISFSTSNPYVGTAVGYQGLILETVDGGETWSNNTTYTEDFYNVQMVSGNVGYICGWATFILKSEFQDNDLYVFEYQGLDTICASVPTDVVITFYNAGSGPLELVDFVLADETGPIHYYQWTGLIQGGEYKDINLGPTAIDHSGYYSVAFAGDSIDVNNTSSKYIHVLSDLSATSGPHEICSGDSVEISIASDYDYLWLFETVDSLDESQIVKPASSMTYFVQVKSNYCVGLDSVNVIVDPCTEPVTAFSPNGDGINDVLIIDNLNGQENSLKIYNRWGDLINSYTNYDNSIVFWDGSGSNGEPLKEGTYYYIFETTDNSIVLSSWVQIVR